jgi:hypothetical protein
MVNRGAVVGLTIIAVSEAATLAHLEPFWSWNTPICWTGFILFADSVVRRARGDSWLWRSRREFIVLALVSIPSWLVFEFYNLFIHNWYYVGLPDNIVLRYVGYAWAFATISPALFEGAELVAIWITKGFRTVQPDPARGAGPRQGAQPSHGERSDRTSRYWSPWRTASLALGAAMLVSPFVASASIAPYLAAPVWLGFIFVLDPINDRLGFQSIAGDWREGRTDRLINLLLSGLLCGVLWEFWNYWSRSKWHYAVPILPNVRIFEMPLPGYFGFPPFAVECFAIYVFIRGIVGPMVGLSAPKTPPRQIGL